MHQKFTLNVSNFFCRRWKYHCLRESQKGRCIAIVIQSNTFILGCDAGDHCSSALKPPKFEILIHCRGKDSETQDTHVKMSNMEDYLKIEKIGQTPTDSLVLYEPFCTGEGTYGIVYKGKCKKTGEIVAMKKIRLESEQEGVSSFKKLLKRNELIKINM